MDTLEDFTLSEKSQVQKDKQSSLGAQNSRKLVLSGLDGGSVPTGEKFQQKHA